MKLCLLCEASVLHPHYVQQKLPVQVVDLRLSQIFDWHIKAPGLN